MMKLEVKYETSKEAIQEMAEILHESCCTQDHADTCGWYYDGDNENTWNQRSHVMWYQKAKRFMEVLKTKYEKKEESKK